MKEEQQIQANADLMANRETITITDPKNHENKITVHSIDGQPGMYRQTFSKESQVAVDDLARRRESDKQLQGLDGIYILKKKSFHAIAGYDPKTNCLYISEECFDEEKLNKELSTGHFAARNIDDIIIHEMAHKRHRDAVKRYAKMNNLTNEADAKQRLETNVREYITRQMSNDSFYVWKTVSENAWHGIDKKGSLNELFGDCAVLIQNGKLQDQTLARLVKEVLYYDGGVST